MNWTFKSFNLAVLLVVALVTPPRRSWSTPCDPMCPDNRTYVVYGATLGQGWQGVESLMSPDYETAGFQFQLDVELPIYVEYVVSNAPASCFPSLGDSYTPGT
jgi:hypothetical protein